MRELLGKRIVITGATGFIGRNMVRLLLERGAEVYALVRAESRQRETLPIHDRLHMVTGSLADILSLTSQIGCADVFFHFAWGGVNREEIDSPQIQSANIAASLDCARAAQKMGCKVFMDAGSRVEYGIKEDGVMEESMECCPINEYGKAKLEFYRQAKPLFRSWDMTYYHLRFFSVYGSGDHPWSIISTLTRELPQGKKVSLSACRHRWNFMNIEDVVRAVLKLYQYSDEHEGESCIVNVASTDTRMLKSFTEEIHALCDGKGSLEYGTFVQAREGALSICPETERLKELTGGTWQERVSFAEGIQRMLAE